MAQANTPFSYRELSFTSLIMRLFVGSMLTFLAFNKFALAGPVSEWSGQIVRDYTSTYLPELLVIAVAYLLPYIQLGLGLLILVGLFTRPAIVLASLLFVGATIGATAVYDSIAMVTNSIYMMTSAIGFLFTRWNIWSLDQILELTEMEESIITGEDIEVIKKEEEELKRVANIRR